MLIIPRRRSGPLGFAHCLLCLGALLLGSTLVCAAPLPAEDARARSALFPVLGASPETNWLFGAFYSYHLKLKPGEGALQVPRSRILAFAAYTLNQQFLLAGESRLYSPSGRWRLDTLWSSVWYPNTLYRPGNNSPDIAEAYDELSAKVGVSLLKSVARGWWLGAQTDFIARKVSGVQAGGLLERQLVAGSEGGQYGSVGPLLLSDTRDRAMAPRAGGLRRIDARYYPRKWGTDFEFTQLIFDLREHRTLGANQVVSMQLYGEFHGGHVPFQALASLAGDGRMRGLLEQRFIDNHTISVQGEYRFSPLPWLGLVAFAGTGQVAHHLGALSAREFHLAGGAGLRLALNRHDGVNLRLDFGAASTGDTNFYATVGEAF